MTKEQIKEKLENSLKEAQVLYSKMADQQERMQDVIIMILGALAKLK